MKKNTSNKHYRMKQKLADNSMDENELKGMLNAWTLMHTLCCHRVGSKCTQMFIPTEKERESGHITKDCVFKECPPFLIKKKGKKK